MEIPQPKKRSPFKTFFIRGLTMTLPTLLTIWLLVFAYGFLKENIARPINILVREAVIQFTAYPSVTPQYIEGFKEGLTSLQRSELESQPDPQAAVVMAARRKALTDWWQNSSYPLDTIGLILAFVLVCVLGALLGSLFGRRIFDYLEQQAQRVPGVAQLYPAFKQITDFLIGQDKQTLQFSRVVAVEFPKRGTWMVGFVTGGSLAQLRESMGKTTVSIYIPSTPTPFTGYVITVAEEETIPLKMTIDDALKFVVSGGVVIPAAQLEKLSAAFHSEKVSDTQQADGSGVA
jgi:uncharacterized membrane protein